MRISDWSSDVCSSDLLCRLVYTLRIYGGRDGQGISREGVQVGQLACVAAAEGAGSQGRRRNGGPRGAEQIHLRTGRYVRPKARYQWFCRKGAVAERSEEQTSELQSLMRISYAVF